MLGLSGTAKPYPPKKLSVDPVSMNRYSLEDVIGGRPCCKTISTRAYTYTIVASRRIFRGPEHDLL